MHLLNSSESYNCVLYFKFCRKNYNDPIHAQNNTRSQLGTVQGGLSAIKVLTPLCEAPDQEQDWAFQYLLVVSRPDPIKPLLLHVLNTHFKLSLASHHYFSQAHVPDFTEQKHSSGNTHDNLQHTKTTIPAQHSITGLRLQSH